jgi:hypothetical protein
MKYVKVSSRLLAAALLLSGIPTLVFAQDKDSQSRDRTKTETSITGCLNKDAAGGFTITEKNRRQDARHGLSRPGKTLGKPQGDFDGDIKGGRVRQDGLRSKQD